MSLAARYLLEDKVCDIIEMLFPDLETEEYLRVENEICSRVMNHDFAVLLTSKLDINARMLAIMLLEYTADNMDLKKLREEFLNGTRKIQEKETAIRDSISRKR